MKKIILFLFITFLLVGCTVAPEIPKTDIEENVMGGMEKIIETGYHRVFYFYDITHGNECYIYFQPPDSVGSISCIKK